MPDNKEQEQFDFNDLKPFLLNLENFSGLLSNFLHESEIETKNYKNSNTLELRPVEIPEKYRKKWNIHQTDYLHLYKDGKKVNNHYYRVGGFSVDLRNRYFMIIKHVEAYYKDSITKDKKRKPHLEGRWVIIDKYGVEKVEFDSFDHGCIKGNGQVYSLKGSYYNIETGEKYCEGSSSMCSDDFIFIENNYNKDKSKRGVWKINLHDGSYEIFPKQ